MGQYPTQEHDPVAAGSLAAHAALASGVHGVPAFASPADDGRGLLWGGDTWTRSATPLVVRSELDAHAADTTNVHGVVDMTALVLTTDPRLVEPAGAVVLVPTTTARNIVQPTADVTPLVVRRRAAADVENLTQWQSEDGGIMAFVSAGGSGKFGRVAVGQATPTSGISLISQAPTINDVPIIARGAGGSVGDIIRAEDSAGSLKVNIGNGWVGTTSLRAAGGTADRISFTTTNVGALFPAPGAAYTPIVSRGSAGQTGDLAQYQNSSGSLLSKITAAGQFQSASAALSLDTANVKLTLDRSGFTPGAGTALTIKVPAGETSNPLVVQDSTGATLNAIRSDGFVRSPGYLSAGDVGAFLDMRTAGNIIASQRVTHIGSVPFITKGATGQTADLLQAQDVNGVVLSYIDSKGNLKAGTGGAVDSFIGLGQTARYVPSDNGGRAGLVGSGDVYINIDANNDQADRAFYVYKDHQNLAAGTKLFSVNEDGHIGLINAIAPVTPVAGGVLYVTAGTLRFKGSGGTDTLIAAA